MPRLRRNLVKRTASVERRDYISKREAVNIFFSTSGQAFDGVFQLREGRAQTLDHTGLGLPESAPLGFEQARDERARRVRIQASEAFEHFGVEDERARDLRVDPVVNGVGGRAPPEGVRDVALYLGHAAEAMLEHALVPLRVQSLRARLKPHHLLDRA